jgi:hypothetical protein
MPKNLHNFSMQVALLGGVVLTIVAVAGGYIVDSKTMEERERQAQWTATFNEIGESVANAEEVFKPIESDVSIPAERKEKIRQSMEKLKAEIDFLQKEKLPTQSDSIET